MVVLLSIVMLGSTSHNGTRHSARSCRLLEHELMASTASADLQDLDPEGFAEAFHMASPATHPLQRPYYADNWYQLLWVQLM